MTQAIPNAELATRLKAMSRDDLEDMLHFLNGWDPGAVVLAVIYHDNIQAKAAATPDPDACKCGHPGYEHIFTGVSPCTKCDCKGFYAAATAILAKAIETGTPVIVTEDDGQCPAVSPWRTRCVMTIAEHDADPRIAHHDSNGDTWFDPQDDTAGDSWCYSRNPDGVLCELAANHEPPHRSPGYNQGDPDITWTDEHATAGAA